MFGRLGAPEIIIILAVVLLLFGAKRLPDMARSLGQSLRILKNETKAMRTDDVKESDSDARPAAAVLQGAHEGRHTTSDATEADTAQRR
ncbi:Sec-independent protein translocase subunit TatA [Streptomyces sp. NPDC055722]